MLPQRQPLLNSMILRLQNYGFRRLLFFKYRYPNFSTAAILEPKTHFLMDYLVNSLGFSKDEALSATKKIPPCKSSRKPKNPALVLNFLENLNLNKTQIKRIVSTDPRILSCDVDKTLQPKIDALQNLGISGSDLIRVLMYHKGLLRRGLANIITPMEYLRKMLGSDEKAAMAVKRCATLLHGSLPKLIAPNVQLLKRAGFSDEKVFSFMLKDSRRVMQRPEWLEEILRRVENEFGICRISKMFYHGVDVLSSLSQSTIDLKFSILRSFGWSDSNINNLVRSMPSILCKSEAKLRQRLKFFMEELGYTPEYLASHPVLLALSLEGRVKPRVEVFKILNEKKLSKRKTSLYTVLCLPESRFLKDYLLPHKDELPDVVILTSRLGEDSTLGNFDHIDVQDFLNVGPSPFR